MGVSWIQYEVTRQEMFVLRNIEARSCNLYCSGKAKSIAQPACVCSLKYSASNAHEPYCLLYTASLYNIFPHYLINGTIFVKKLSDTKRVFRVSLQLSSETFFILRRTERDMLKNVYWSLCQVPFILVRF